MSILPHKCCTKCGIEQPHSEFYSDRTRKDGLFPQCKTCHKAYSKAYRNSEHGKAWNKAYFQSERGKAAVQKFLVSDKATQWRYAYNRSEKARAYGVVYRRTAARKAAIERYKASGKATAIAKAYWKKHREKLSKKSQQYYEYNKDQIKFNAKRWRHQNRAKRYIYEKRRKAQVLLHNESFTSAQWEELCARYGHRCLACGEQGPLTVDHVIPLSKGGANDISNIQPLCGSCNSKKGVAIVDYR